MIDSMSCAITWQDYRFRIEALNSVFMSSCLCTELDRMWFSSVNEGSTNPPGTTALE
jgi:hypothetical protein